MTNAKPRLAEFKPIGHNPKFKTFPVVKPINAPTKGDMTRARVVSRAEAQRSLIHSALAVPNPNAGLGRFVSADDLDDTTFRLPIESLREYENNPRRRTHASLNDLKESIRAKGIQQIITVTKRPGEDFYIPYSGGNSRLKCAKQLFEERGEGYVRFAHLQVAYRSYTSESDIFAAHIAENEIREDIPFWDKANAAMELKRMIEAEQGKSLSLRELESAFAAKGIPGARAALNYFTFAHARLSELGEAGYYISRTQVQNQLQHAFILWDRLAKRINREQEFLTAINLELHHISQRALMANGLSADSLIADIETNALAPLLNVEVTHFRAAVALLDSFSDLAWEQALAQTDPALRTKYRSPAYDPALPGLSSDRTAALRRQAPSPAVKAGQRSLLPPAVVAASGGLAATSRSTASVEERIEMLLEDVWSCVASFARAIDCAALITQQDEMPLGFFLEAPVDGIAPLLDHDTPDEERRRLSNRRIGWWLLSMAAGQHYEQKHFHHLPESSHWRQHITATANRDSDLDDMSFREQYLFSDMGGEPTMHEQHRFLWFGAASEGCPREQYVELLVLIRTLHELAPARFIPSAEGSQ